MLSLIQSNVHIIYWVLFLILLWSPFAQSIPNPNQEEPVIVAVIDTGLDTNHPSLKDYVWTNPGESGVDLNGKAKDSNGKDDDQNGYIDDVHGWNFVTNNNDVEDRHGHGTHVAGIIAKTTKRKIICANRDLIHSGNRCRQIQLMPLKFYEPAQRNPNSIRSTISAIRYAIKMRAKIINYSAGGFTRDEEEEDLLRAAERQGILFVAAAGNDSINSDIRKYFPADYGLQNVVSVAAVDSSHRLLRSSNFGRRTVDIAALGHDVISTLPGGRFGRMTGTSQATAFVSATAAQILLQSHNQLNTTNLIKSIWSPSIRVNPLRAQTKFGYVLAHDTTSTSNAEIVLAK